MTFDELAAIRAHVARHGSLTWHDGEDLLAEVDGLTALIARWGTTDDEAVAVLNERARILAAVEALPVFESEYGNDLLVPLDDVIAIVKGET